MLKITFVILFVLWIYSYVRFRKRYSYFMNMVQYLEYKLNHAEDIEKGWVMVRLACAHQEVQHYKTAYTLYEQALQLRLVNVDSRHIYGNMKFCMNPVPDISRLQDFHCSYWHHFILLRLGGRRMNFLTDDDFLQLNHFLQMRR